MMRIFSFNKILPTGWAQNSFNLKLNQISTAAFPLQFKASPQLWAEPLKKKKKLDINILKHRVERKKKKIEREIRRLTKLQRQLKPLPDLECPFVLLYNSEERKRVVTVPENVVEERKKLMKKWSQFLRNESEDDIRMIRNLLQAQKRALEELKLESNDLYEAAVKIDENFIPFKFNGPSETPPLSDYPTPDGEFKDVSKKWVPSA